MVRIALLLALVAALASAFVGSSTAAPARLTATVGPGYTITLKKGSTTVRTLKRGTYLVTVRDRSTEHNFHLRGPVGRMRSPIRPGFPIQAVDCKNFDLTRFDKS